ncbi:hypothetical protein FFWV33_11995 [Flavobacterium faecale]|uniref:Uncharacterized protein n=1 Tax=Flavobacterium faecale TaxID=1355330 RepID=A0A2S1LEH7_9FLAO|nr:4'-phosphopantetheinyl transferase superfamily protein [Flavobacterium faecale]AWG22182.1 hypothetical protein FFWV33_11995 [Flavobacterium faecale]
MQKAKLTISTTTFQEGSLSLSLQPKLEQEDILLFTIFLPDFFEIKEHLNSYLTIEEQNKANRFYKTADQNRFVVYRSVLKIILGFFTQNEVLALRFDTKENKKPFLADAPWIHFNISHAEDYAMIALSKTEIGVDIEYIEKDFEFESLIPVIINASEEEVLEKSTDKKRDFYAAWTRKEAVVKATGQGIDDCFQSIPTLDGMHEATLKVDQANTHWSIKGFELATGYIGAIAYNCPATDAKKIRMHKLESDFEQYFK